MPSEQTFPPQPTAVERANGLSKPRLKELQRIAAVLKQHSVNRTADEAIAAAAAELGVKPSTFARRFGELARCADWKSTKPDDWLVGRETKHGGYRHGQQSTEPKVHRGGWAPKSMWDDFDLALSRTGLSFEDFCAGAARHVLAGGCFLTLDSQKESV